MKPYGLVKGLTMDNWQELDTELRKRIKDNNMQILDVEDAYLQLVDIASELAPNYTPVQIDDSVFFAMHDTF